MTDLVYAQICVRCGSRDHSTRDHDEGKVHGGGTKSSSKPSALKPPPKAVSKKASGKESSVVTHKACWSSVQRNCGIPDFFAKPDKTVFYHDPQNALPGWYVSTCRQNCGCEKCQKKKRERDMLKGELKKKALGVSIR